MRCVHRRAPRTELEVLDYDAVRVLQPEDGADGRDRHQAVVRVDALRRYEVYLPALEVVVPLAVVVKLLAEAAEDVGVARTRHVAELAGELKRPFLAVDVRYANV